MQIKVEHIVVLMIKIKKEKSYYNVSTVVIIIHDCPSDCWSSLYHVIMKGPNKSNLILSKYFIKICPVGLDRKQLGHFQSQSHRTVRTQVAAWQLLLP